MSLPERIDPAVLAEIQRRINEQAEGATGELVSIELPRSDLAIVCYAIGICEGLMRGYPGESAKSEENPP